MLFGNEGGDGSCCLQLSRSTQYDTQDAPAVGVSEDPLKESVCLLSENSMGRKEERSQEF